MNIFLVQQPQLEPNTQQKLSVELVLCTCVSQSFQLAASHFCSLGSKPHTVPASLTGRSKHTVPSPLRYRHQCIVLDNSAFLPGLFGFIPPLSLLLQVWAEAASRKGADLTTEEKWSSGTELIATLGDPVAAERVHREANNYYRLVRVLEVVLHTGKTLAEFEAKPDVPINYDFRCVVVLALTGPWVCVVQHPLPTSLVIQLQQQLVYETLLQPTGFPSAICTGCCLVQQNPVLFWLLCLISTHVGAFPDVFTAV